MALLQLPLRLKADTHAALHDAARQRNKAAGNVVSDLLQSATDDAVVDALKKRLDKGTTIEPHDKKTLSLVSASAISNLTRLSDTTGLPKDFLVRLILEANLPTTKQNP